MKAAFMINGSIRNKPFSRCIHVLWHVGDTGTLYVLCTMYMYCPLNESKPNHFETEITGTVANKCHVSMIECPLNYEPFPN